MRRIAAPLALACALTAVAVTAGSSAAAAPRCVAGSLRPVGTEREAFAALVARDSVDTWSRAGGGTRTRFPALNENGYPTTFEIAGAVLTGTCEVSWYRVRLPVRPNGTAGYLRPGDVKVQKIETRIVVDLSDRMLTLALRGRVVIRTRVAVGAASTPTPLGRYYVNQRITTTDPSGPYGPAALGVSAFSNVLTGWAQGGPIGIHGTNRPWLIGQAISNGCIRVENSVLQRLFDSTLGGTPVIIKA